MFDDWISSVTYCRFEGKVFNERDFIRRKILVGLPIKSTKVGYEQKLATAAKTLFNVTSSVITTTLTRITTMTIFIVDIEAVDTRYTKQWKEYLPKQLQHATNEDVVVISGGETPQATTPGAFLNFGGTNVYKSKQLETIGEMFCKGQVADGDYFYTQMLGTLLLYN